MRLSGVHLLLTYGCNYECDHCFVWSSPWQPGTMTLHALDEILRQARELSSVDWIYFEGGEPFLHYAVLLRAVKAAAAKKFRVGIVSNGYWATDVEDGIESLRPFKGLVQDLSISRDEYHGSDEQNQLADHACQAARELGIPTGNIAIAQPEATNTARAVGQLPTGDSAVLYRGRAAEVLSPRADKQPWAQFNECPCENLREPGRVHVDPFGNVHICQGICLGNVFRTTLKEICRDYDPDDHPITGPLLKGGPAALALEYGGPNGEMYADACHLCYETRRAIRSQFPEILGPDQMYGVVGAECEAVAPH